MAEWAVRGYEQGEAPVWSDFWQMSEDDWRSGVVWLRQERQMRIDDATMLMLRVVDDRVAAHAGERTDRTLPAGRSGRVSALAWLPVGRERPEIRFRQVAEQADHASERVIQGLRGLKDRALKKYRETFGKKNEPHE